MTIIEQYKSRKNFRIGLLFLLIILFVKGISQNSMFLKLAPLSLLDVGSGSSVRIGIEKQVLNDLSYYIELGTYIPKLNFYDKISGATFKCELKHYFQNSVFQNGQYISLEYFSKYQTFIYSDSISSRPNYFKQYYLQKLVNCVSLKYGSIMTYGKNFLIDYFVGFGCRLKSVKSGLSTTEYNNIIKDPDPYAEMVSNYTREKGVRLRLNVDIGMKIGFRIK